MFRDLGLLALRLVVGSVFAAHGYPKLFGGPGKRVPPRVAELLGNGFVRALEHGSPQNFVATVERVGAPRPMVTAWLIASLEFFGGIMLALGLFTRPTAFLLAVEMIEAIRRVHWRNGLVGAAGFELPLTLLGSCLALAGSGPGAISLDGGEQSTANDVVAIAR